MPRGGHHNKGRSFAVEAVRNEEFAKLLDACIPLGIGRRYEISAARLRAIMVVLFRSGLRVGEALDLVESDLDHERGTILVRHGKGGKRRVAIMDQWGWVELDHWMKIREAIRPGALFPVITGLREGEPMSSCMVRQQFRDARDRAGLRIRGNPHSYRHGFAVTVRAEINDLTALQHALGHESPSTTAIYLRSIGALEAMKPIRNRQIPMIPISHQR